MYARMESMFIAAAFTPKLVLDKLAVNFKNFNLAHILSFLAYTISFYSPPFSADGGIEAFYQGGHASQVKVSADFFFAGELLFCYAMGIAKFFNRLFHFFYLKEFRLT